MSDTFSDSTGHHINTEVENKYLKITIAVLREKIEDVQRQQSEIVQQTQAHSQNEIIQLQSMVNTLRYQLEKSENTFRQEIQKEEVKLNDENSYLKNAVCTLREKLEVKDEDKN